MTPDASAGAAAPTPQSTPEVSLDLQVRLKTEDGQLLLLLPPETNNEPATGTASTWTELCQQLKLRLNAGERFWQPNAEVQLMGSDRLLDIRQLQEIAGALLEAELQLKRVHTSRRQTAVAAATAGYSVEQQPPVSTLAKSAEKPQSLAEPLYLQMTVRSGQEIRHPGTIVLLGDVNPGGSVVAGGDILVWGRLRGVVHAGAGGNTNSVIMALQMEPMVIRIAKYVARGPETSPAQFFPEVAYVTPQGIRIGRASDFDKSQLIGGN
ncbi:MAG: septum site-determining protein MinC [Microcoleus sp. PH2017_10_PVI_O_A]|uniref:septum site-determining protein MinC n=1 Tax=unclassified Microcoleus TaxID=2642155 RepID=UPI001D6D1F5B|nr:MULTISPECIES: septum site-determining protein MinC [unclassified Microcoleus]TAE84643.1 MAG: septum site-determining protein MinC [Oscillatoriales cyanobacterium]MCC3405064.1 septum site-determining protein MinC [Microcoleus sp. PH2017_10_PVI_O_A]MCC3459185.1 septum site-determining protein MinC [Microcoleus sp. PH2017_11_PCY_U_A]MCC3477307.1 septum site-determining protein MinC [Microcoleus sp. PH2017_12_PCY_D_A]MCC3527618.1 septum site-determining protein MinC [Microcoleus sp. PH2017_21_R